MPIKSKVFIQTLQKSQDRHKICFAFEFNNKNNKKVFVIGFSCRGRFAPPQIQLGLNLLCTGDGGGETWSLQILPLSALIQPTFHMLLTRFSKVGIRSQNLDEIGNH